MRGAWTLPRQQELAGDIATRHVKDVLLEHDEPLLAVFSNGRDDFLGLVVDSDENVTRWLQAPLSHLELDALVGGVRPVRDAILKRTIWVVDYPRDELERAVAVWRVDASDIPESVLPKRGLTLAPYKAPAVAEPVMRFAGEGAARDGITLSQLGALAGTLHRVFVSIARDLIGMTNPVPISLFAAMEGSLAVKVHVDNPQVYELIVSRYRDLIRGVDDDTVAKKIAATMPPVVIEALDDHLDALDKQGAEMLASWSSGAVFVGPGDAERARDAYSSDVEPPAAREEPREYTGYFEGFWRKRPARFEFYDVDAADTFIGNVSAPVVRALSNALASLTIGHMQRKYRIKVLCTIDASGVIQGRRLLEFSPVIEPPSQPSPPVGDTSDVFPPRP